MWIIVTYFMHTMQKRIQKAFFTIWANMTILGLQKGFEKSLWISHAKYIWNPFNFF